jgi:hypothetical protein
MAPNATLSNDVVSSIYADPEIYYSSTPIIHVDPSPTGKQAKATATLDNLGRISSVNISDGGSGYTSAPNVVILSGIDTATNASIEQTISKIYSSEIQSGKLTTDHLKVNYDLIADAIQSSTFGCGPATIQNLTVTTVFNSGADINGSRDLNIIGTFNHAGDINSVGLNNKLALRDTRLTALEGSSATQAGYISDLQSHDTDHETRISSLETSRTTDETNISTLQQQTASLSSSKADTSYVDSVVAPKADTSYVNTGLASKADKSYTDSTFQPIIDKTVDVECHHLHSYGALTVDTNGMWSSINAPLTIPNGKDADGLTPNGSDLILFGGDSLEVYYPIRARQNIEIYSGSIKFGAQGSYADDDQITYDTDAKQLILKDVKITKLTPDAQNFDSVPTSGSSKLITSGAVYSAVLNAINGIPPDDYSMLQPLITTSTDISCRELQAKTIHVRDPNGRQHQMKGIHNSQFDTNCVQSSAFVQTFDLPQEYNIDPAGYFDSVATNGDYTLNSGYWPISCTCLYNGATPTDKINQVAVLAFGTNTASAKVTISICFSIPSPS